MPPDVLAHSQHAAVHPEQRRAMQTTGAGENLLR
jgi:hypothetical protein